jgi:hypothetical protein
VSTSIDVATFNQRVKAGEKLVILDDMVLDVSKFQSSHPGGKFVIEHNIGKDISKYFYGGYSLENSWGNRRNTHSSIARRIVNGLIVARLGKKVNTFSASIIEKTEVNKSTATYTFQIENAVDGVQDFYSDLQMVGRHYLVSSLFKDKVHRQYTVANCMRKIYYDQYLKLVSDKLNGQDPNGMILKFDED